MIKQRTLKEAIQVTGIGLHSGKKASLTLRPAAINTGIVFRRTDLTPVVEIPALYDKVCDTTLCTTLGVDGVRVATVEHLLSALAGLDISNVIIDVNGPEIPIMDGSAKWFAVSIQDAGIREQSAAKRFIRITKPLRVEDKDKFVQFLPFNGYKVSVTIDFNHPVFDDQPRTAHFDFSTTSYVQKICRARTFGFLSDYELLRENDLAKGGSLDNAIVVDQYRILNEDGLRFEGELVTHKVLDAIGDLNLLGCGLIGAFEGYKSGHELNNRILRELMAEQDAWEYTYFDADNFQPSFLPASVIPIPT